MRLEVDSSNLCCHLPHHPTPTITFPSSARKWAVMDKDNSTLYTAYLLSDFRTLPPLKKKPTASDRPSSLLREISRPSRTASPGMIGLGSKEIKYEQVI
ncbi:hypothetical protein AVEN_46518-1 [Araneus ventricosus]|uniref:Uncharacterized protein n=1 Tax=Araneus ventricosus TaxID=182803 RepID=A0A4Y2HBM1_ARAVE|nr:hypothetical protein AVEN_46518-1 [Araneus ventricosus]